MNKEIKENLTGLMVTLGTDTERKFTWCYNVYYVYILYHRNVKDCYL